MAAAVAQQSLPALSMPTLSTGGSSRARPTAAQLNSALLHIAEEFTRHTPPEVLRLLPTWKSELPELLQQRSREELAVYLRGLEVQSASQEADATVAYAFAKNALNAALEIHDAARDAQREGLRMVHAARAAGCFVITSACDAFISTMCGPKVFFSLDVDLKAMIDDAKFKAPAVVRQAFDDFDKDLSDLLSKSLPELRAANARLVTALADTEIRCFTEETENPDTATSIEATALGYTVRALQIVIKKRSATSIAARLSTRRPSTPQAAVAPLARGGSSSPTARGGGKFAANGFSAATASKPGTPIKKASATNAANAKGGKKSKQSNAANTARCGPSAPNVTGTGQRQPLSMYVPLSKVAPVSAKAGAGVGGFASAGDAFNPCCGDWPNTKNDDRSIHGKGDVDSYFSEPHTLGLDDFDVQELDSFLNMCDSDLNARSDIELC